MDNCIRVFDVNGNILSTYEGHTKGVISLSWTHDNFLLSGSWDGTAKLWDLESSQCIQTLGTHENGVHAIGLPDGRIATVSTGESVNERPANFQLRFWDPSSGKQIGGCIKDHTGSIRSICPTSLGFATSSNDGTVLLRTPAGDPIGQIFHPPQEGEGSLPFVLDCTALQAASGDEYIVSCGEDGSVILSTVAGDLIQSIPHPSSTWTVLPLPCGDFVTGCHDGSIRVFSCDTQKNETPEAIALQSSFEMFVAESIQRKKKGPDAAEIAKYAKWEDRGRNPGKNIVFIMYSYGMHCAFITHSEPKPEPEF